MDNGSKVPEAVGPPALAGAFVFNPANGTSLTLHRPEIASQSADCFTPIILRKIIERIAEHVVIEEVIRELRQWLDKPTRLHPHNCQFGLS